MIKTGHKVFFNEYAYSRFVESHPEVAGQIECILH